MLNILQAISFLDSWIAIIFAFILSYLIYFVLERKIHNLPPGPLGLPFLGYAPFIKVPPFRQFTELSKTYGDIVRIKVFGTNIITLNTYDAIKECFSTRGDHFSGRVVIKKSFFWHLFKGLGFLQEEGPVWREHRRFSLHTLKDFGFGKLSLEARVQEIGGDLVQGLIDTGGKPYDPMNLLANAAFNVILYLTTDKHFKPDDPDFRMIRRNVRNIITRIASIGIFVATPTTKLLPMSWQPNFSIVDQVAKENIGLATKYVTEHQNTFDENNLRDYIDVYLDERNTAIKEGNTETTFTIERLKIILLNLLVAGTETTSNTLYWALRIISGRPDIQEKLHHELDEVVGRDRLPSILDRANLPYTDAVILEILRFTTITPLGLPHSNPAACELKGYQIPARSVVLANLWAVHNDPEFWVDPDKFDPDRFLDPETKAQRRERVVSFSLGKRACLGEALARMELFLFLTMLMQKFTFQLQESDTGDLRENRTLLRILVPYEICAQLR